MSSHCMIRPFIPSQFQSRCSVQGQRSGPIKVSWKAGRIGYWHARVPCRQRSTTIAASESLAETGSLPAELQKIVSTFSMVPDPKIKYQQLLYLGKKLDPMPAAEHTEENKVKGCVSQVWVVPELKNGKVYWRADSDSMLTKGLAALLVKGLSDCTPEEIVRINPELLESLGLGQALTPSRNNGFLNMLKLMQAKSLQLLSTQ